MAYKKRAGKVFIIDPTIRFETNDDLDETVRREKEMIYNPYIPELKRRYTKLADREFEVIGLWMGARGTVGHSLLEFFEQFDLPKRCSLTQSVW